MNYDNFLGAVVFTTMIFGFVAFCAILAWADVQKTKIDAEMVELNWSPCMPTEEGFYWFKGTIEYGPNKNENELFVFVVHSSKERTLINETVIYEKQPDDEYEFKYTGQWAKLEKPK